MLRDLSIQNYRTFKDFSIDSLARVNLIVGKNNSGKTSFLEAVYLLVNRANPSCLGELLAIRGELAEVSTTVAIDSIEYQIQHIFHGHAIETNGRENVPPHMVALRSQHDSALALQIRLNLADSASSGNLFPSRWDRFKSDILAIGEPSFMLEFIYGQQSESIAVPVRNDYSVPSSFLQARRQSRPYRLVTTSHLDFAVLAELWNNITLTPEEDHVVEALRVLEPSVEGVRFLSRQTANSGVVIKLQGHNGPLPLGSMGEGMRRMLTLAMSAVMSKDGVLLVDEIDTGLYHDAQTDMWRLLIETAQRLNVQIFATTHSWDCVAAFQEALAQSGDESVGRLFRLESHDGDIRAVMYSDRQLAVAVRQAIEVR